MYCTLVCFVGQVADFLQALCQVTQRGQLQLHNFTPAPCMEDVDSEDSNRWCRKYPDHCEDMDPPTATYHSFALPATTTATPGRPPVPVKRVHRSKSHCTLSPHVAPPSAGTRSSHKAKAQSSGGSLSLVALPSTGKRSCPEAVEKSNQSGTGGRGKGKNLAEAKRQNAVTSHAERGGSCPKCALLAAQIQLLKQQLQSCQKKHYYGA